MSLERYGKGPGDIERYHETMCISSDLKSIERAFLALPNDGTLPKETILIQTLKGMLKPGCRVTLIGHIIATNFEESLSTLQYVERCKGEVVASDKNKEMKSLGASATQQMMRNLRQLNEEYKEEIEDIEKKHAIQFERIKHVLALNIDLKAMAQRGPTQSDKTILENSRQAASRAKNFTDRNAELNSKLKKTRREVYLIKQKIEDRVTYFDKLIADLNEELNKLTLKSNDLKGVYENIHEDMGTKINKVRKKIMDEKQIDLEERLDILFSSQGVMDQHTQAMAESTKIFENMKKAVGATYVTKMKEIRKMQDNSVESLAIQFQRQLEVKKQRNKEFRLEAETYCHKKNESKQN